MPFWNPEKIRYMEDAVTQVPFSERLAAEAAAFLPRNAILCDAGCGLGFLSMSLSPYCREVIAADNDESVLCVLRKHLPLRGIQNVTPTCCDIFALSDDVKFDAMVFCFFGSIEETLTCAKKHCRGNVIMFKKDWHNHRFSLTEKPIEKIRHSNSEAELEARRIPFESKSFEVDMGQPFRTIDDAIAFFHLYERGARREIAPETVAAMLETRKHPEFPYYLPAIHKVGMIVVDAAQIPPHLLTGGT